MDRSIVPAHLALAVKPYRYPKLFFIFLIYLLGIHMSRFIICILILVWLPLIGCNYGPTLGQVSGTVLYEGEPLPHGTISFELTGGKFAHGEIKDGQILNVRTNDPGDGVPVGNATIAINSVAMTSEPSTLESATGASSGMAVGRDLIPVRYANPATSGLTAVIEPGENLLTFELTKRQ